jgi:hypothetical protein
VTRGKENLNLLEENKSETETIARNVHVAAEVDFFSVKKSSDQEVF